MILRWATALILPVLMGTVLMGTALMGTALLGKGDVTEGAAPGDYERARDSLLAALSLADSDAIFLALEQLEGFDNGPLATILVEKLLQHDDLLVHKEAVDLLSRRKSADARKVVVECAARHKSWERRAQCVRILAFFGGQHMQNQVEKALADKRWQVRSAALRGLGSFRNKVVLELLIGRLKQDRGRLLADVIWSLKAITGEDFEGRYDDWHNWYEVRKHDYEIPTPAEIDAKNGTTGEKAQDVRTAVEDGLYGPIYSEKTCFILDVSGSMTAGTEEQGSRLSIAVTELSRVLADQLTPDSLFNVVAFSDEPRPFFKRLKKAKKRVVKRATKNLEKLRAGGETNAYGALQVAFSDPDVDTVFLLSDGVPTAGDPFIPELIRMKVEEWNRNRRVIINCIGFFPGNAKNQDKEAAREFLRELAHENEGYYKEVY